MRIPVSSNQFFLASLTHERGVGEPAPGRHIQIHTVQGVAGTDTRFTLYSYAREGGRAETEDGRRTDLDVSVMRRGEAGVIWIRLKLPVRASARLEIVGADGRRCAVLIGGVLEGGTYEIPRR